VFELGGDANEVQNFDREQMDIEMMDAREGRWEELKEVDPE